MEKGATPISASREQRLETMEEEDRHGSENFLRLPEGGAVMSARELLLEYTLLLNKHGTESLEAMRFLEDNKANLEFVRLAETARWLKKALTPNGAHPVEQRR